MVITVQEMQLFLFQIICFSKTFHTMSYCSITSLGKHLVPLLLALWATDIGNKAEQNMLSCCFLVHSQPILCAKEPFSFQQNSTSLSQKRCIRRFHFQEREQILNEIPQLPKKGPPTIAKDKLQNRPQRSYYECLCLLDSCVYNIFNLFPPFFLLIFLYFQLNPTSFLAIGHLRVSLLSKWSHSSQKIRSDCSQATERAE